MGQNFATYQASAERQGVLVELEILQDELAPYIKNMRGLEQFEQALKKRIELERKLSTAYNKRTRSGLKKELRALTQRLDSAFYRAYPKRERASCAGKTAASAGRLRPMNACSSGTGPQPLEKYIREFEDKRPSWKPWAISNTMSSPRRAPCQPDPRA